MSREHICPLFLHRSGDAGASIYVVSTVLYVPHSVLDISTAKSWQQLGHFTDLVKALQQVWLTATCGPGAGGLFQCLQPVSKRHFPASV